MWGRLARRAWGTSSAVPPLEGAVIGDLEGPVAVLDERGRLQMIDRRWSFEWGVGVGDRWRVAHTTTGSRRHRIDDAPVYETRLRVPAGDVVHRLAVANDGVSRAIIVEFENASSSAVAVALVGRAYGVELAATRDAVSLGGQVWIQPRASSGGSGSSLWRTGPLVGNLPRPTHSPGLGSRHRGSGGSGDGVAASSNRQVPSGD